MSRIRRVMRELSELHRFQLRLQQRKRRQAERREQSVAAERAEQRASSSQRQTLPPGASSEGADPYAQAQTDG